MGLGELADFAPIPGKGPRARHPRTRLPQWKVRHAALQRQVPASGPASCIKADPVSAQDKFVTLVSFIDHDLSPALTVVLRSKSLLW